MVEVCDQLYHSNGYVFKTHMLFILHIKGIYSNLSQIVHLSFNSQEGADPFGTQLPDKFVLKKSYWRYLYLLNSLLLEISSHGYRL